MTVRLHLLLLVSLFSGVAVAQNLPSISVIARSCLTNSGSRTSSPALLLSGTFSLLATDGNDASIPVGGAGLPLMTEPAISPITNGSITPILIANPSLSSPPPAFRITITNNATNKITTYRKVDIKAAADVSAWDFCQYQTGSVVGSITSTIIRIQQGGTGGAFASTTNYLLKGDGISGSSTASASDVGTLGTLPNSIAGRAPVATNADHATTVTTATSATTAARAIHATTVDTATTASTATNATHATAADSSPTATARAAASATNATVADTAITAAGISGPATTAQIVPADLSQNGAFEVGQSNTGSDVTPTVPAANGVKYTVASGPPAYVTPEGTLHTTFPGSGGGSATLGGVSTEIQTNAAGTALGGFGIFSNGSSVATKYPALQNCSESGLAPGFPTTVGVDCNLVQGFSSGIGYNGGSAGVGNTSGWAIRKALHVIQKSNTEGISEALTVELGVNEAGDATGESIYMTAKGDTTKGADEGDTGLIVHMDQDSGVFGGIIAAGTSTCTPAPCVTITATRDQEGAMGGGTLINLSHPVATGHILSDSGGNVGNTMGTLPTDSTLTPTAFAAVAPGSITVPQLGGLATVTLNVSRGTAPVGQILSFACAESFDSVRPTSVTGSGSTISVTATFRYSHAAGCNVFAGDPAFLDLTADQNGVMRTSYMAFSTGVHQWSYRLYLGGGQAGNIYPFHHIFGTTSAGAYTAYPGTIIQAVNYNYTVANGKIQSSFSGRLSLVPTDTVFAPSDLAENPQGNSFTGRGVSIEATVNSTPTTSGNTGAEVNVHGAGFTGISRALRVFNRNPFSMYYPYGGDLGLLEELVELGGPHADTFNIQNAPYFAALNIRTPEGCLSGGTAGIPFDVYHSYLDGVNSAYNKINCNTHTQTLGVDGAPNTLTVGPSGVTVAGVDPTDANGVVTKHYLEAHAGGGPVFGIPTVTSRRGLANFVSSWPLDDHAFTLILDPGAGTIGPGVDVATVIFGKTWKDASGNQVHPGCIVGGINNGALYPIYVRLVADPPAQGSITLTTMPGTTLSRRIGNLIYVVHCAASTEN